MEDETDLLMFPPLRAGWSLAGDPVEVPLSGRNDRRVVFGAMELKSGHRLFLTRHHQRSADMIAFLEALHERSRRGPIALLLDEDSSHTAQATQTLAEERGMICLWLPKRAPELNPMEGLWGHGKDLISANRQFATVEEQAVRFVEFLEGLSDHQALRLSGVLSEDFWLKKILSKNFWRDA